MSLGTFLGYGQSILCTATWIRLERLLFSFSSAVWCPHPSSSWSFRNRGKEGHFPISRFRWTYKMGEFRLKYSVSLLATNIWGGFYFFQIVPSLINGVITALYFILWGKGLKSCGPLRYSRVIKHPHYFQFSNFVIGYLRIHHRFWLLKCRKVEMSLWERLSYLNSWILSFLSEICQFKLHHLSFDKKKFIFIENLILLVNSLCILLAERSCQSTLVLFLECFLEYYMGGEAKCGKRYSSEFNSCHKYSPSSQWNKLTSMVDIAFICSVMFFMPQFTCVAE